MRHPMIGIDQTMFARDGRTGTIKLDLRELDQLAELADSTAQKAAEGLYEDPTNVDMAAAGGYALGVAEALAWLAGHHADERLTALLDIDEDQR